MRNTLEIECLVQSLQNAIDTRVVEVKARDAYDGCSWDYFGAEYIKASEDAMEDFQKRLDKYIESRVAQAVAKALSASQV